jgi:hypothetical protein
LNGLVPFDVIDNAPVTLSPVPGVLRVWIDLPAGIRLDPKAPVQLRVYGGEAGFEVDRNGEIVDWTEAKLPIEQPYRPRTFPGPPERGQMALELSFQFVWGTGVMIQDVQWRQAIVWHKKGAKSLEFRYTLVP